MDSGQVASRKWPFGPGRELVGRLVYMFASLAARHANGATCLEGIQLLADTLHPHGVPITWIVSAESARIASEWLKRWHESYNDDIAVSTPALSGALKAKCRQMMAEREAVLKVAPWSRATIAASGHTDPEIAAVLEDTGFEGIWGFCWEQIDVDAITDRGCPWGFYYMDRAQRLRPAQGRGVVGMEWTARDLLKSFHSGNPCLYSTDPNDVARGGLCSWENIGYLERMADNYLRNTRYNDHVFLLQHQEAHEMERTLCQCYTEEDIREAAVILDRFAAYMKERASMMTLAEAATLYRERHAHTASSYMLWEDTPTLPYNPDYAWSTPVGPWPKTFLYCDRGAQMMFVEGKVEPVCIRNYERPYVYGEFFAESGIPRTRLVHDTRYGWSRDIEIRVDSPRAMPYGIALWNDYSLYQIASAPGLVEGKILPRELMFLRYDLKAGENLLRVELQGK